MVAAYTAQFGGGFSATISAEERRMTNIVGFGNAATGVSGAGYGGFQAPDVVANLRVDQAWGSAQIMGALHEVNATYYDAAFAGHPSDKWGFAVGAGIKLNAPMIGPGDYFQAQVNYAEGASRYVFATPNSNWGFGNGASRAFGVLSDGVFGGTIAGGTATSVELTKAWGFNAAYEHFWNQQWKTSVYGGYAAVRYGDRGNAMLCVLQGNGVGVGATAVAGLGCDNNWNSWWVGSRTQWNITKDFYMGLDVLYSKLNTANVGVPVLGITNSSEDNVAVRFRVHRDFMP
jgi:hypothetical protein